ncbi:hypothetical protein V6N13_042948 [Hibiscus sabdariffa]
MHYDNCRSLTQETRERYLLSLLRGNNRVEDLLRYAIGLGLINGVDTLKEGRDRDIQSLTLQSLPQLISFCPQNKANATGPLPQHELSLFSEKILFPYLEKLWLKSINVTRAAETSLLKFCSTIRLHFPVWRYCVLNS